MKRPATVENPAQNANSSANGRRRVLKAVGKPRKSKPSRRTAVEQSNETIGYTGAKHILLGSTAERVARHAPCPVLTVPRRVSKHIGKTRPFRLRKILVPVDFSEISEEALPWATSLAAHFSAEIILMHVVEKFPIDYLLGSELTNETVTPLIKETEADLEGVAGSLRKSAGVNISADVRCGKPFEEICQAAKTLGVDLIVLTTRGYTGLKHVWLGSTAERVVRHASCPVLVVRDRENDFLRETSKNRTGSEG